MGLAYYIEPEKAGGEEDDSKRVRREEGLFERAYDPLLDSESETIIIYSFFRGDDHLTPMENFELSFVINSWDILVDAVAYLIDALARERFAASKKELDALLSDEKLENVPFLILGNKIDLGYAASEEELLHYLSLTNFIIGKGKVNLDVADNRPMEAFMCSIARNRGYADGFK
ncbi:unnamed protein product [Dovyalis caffra]|uniref:Uncharacterized protein n=1 Tax=Dovyalis caffra TaxID=77055 RepID=A0AAV1R0K0_9ROSI|nr:unnamed protein product [Dovyalis caffra]